MTLPPDDLRAAVGDSWRVALRTIRLLPSNRGPLWRQVHEYLLATKRTVTTTETNVIPFPRKAR